MLYTTIFACSFFSVTEAVYFSQRLPEICLHIPSQNGVLLGQLYAYPNIDDNCTGNAIHYEVVKSNDGLSDIIDINRTEGWITLRQNLTSAIEGNGRVSSHKQAVLVFFTSHTPSRSALLIHVLEH